MDFLPILQNCPLFDGIRSEDLSGMLGCLGGRTVGIKKGTVLFQEGEKAVHMGIVLEGAVQLVLEDYYGNRSIMAHIGKGELFGESYAFSREGTLPVSIMATTDCRILLIDSRRVTTCCSNACEFHNRVIFNLLRLTASKNQLLHQKLQITARRTTREKLMAYLAFQAKQLDSSEFTIPYDRQALADFLEVDRSGLSAEISKLRREGVLECRKNSFRLL